jgi:RNA polymerase sigma factor (sigma-70 family)
MPEVSLSHVLRHLRTLSEGQATRDLSDGELLERFRVRQEETAFALLVQRHGSMVLGVCRRMLADSHAAEDAFQATFLVLVRKAASIRKRDSVASWLHGVARRIAVRARLQTARDHALERRSVAMPRAEACDEWTWSELRRILDEELEQLPEKYRTPLVLCGLEGKTHEQAARELGCPKSSLSSRLVRARELLRERLTRRGITVSAVALAAMLTEKAPAAVPALLTITTVQAAMRKTGEAISANVATLTEEGIKAMGSSKAKAGLALVAALLTAGMGVVFGHQTRDDNPEPPRKDAPIADQPVAENRKPKTDLHGDPLPPGAIARIGSLRWRHEGEASYLAFSADGKMLAATNQDGTVRLFDTASGKLLYRIRRETAGLPSGFGPLAFSPDGNYLAYQPEYGTVHLWDLKKKQHARTLSAQEERGDGAPFWQISFSPDGKLLAACAGGNCIAVWDVASGRVAANVRGHNHGNPSIVFSPDSKMIAVSSKPIVQLFDANTGKRVRSFNPDQKWALALAFSPDGTTIASGAERLIVLSDVESGKETGRLRLPAFRVGGVLKLAFVPDGKSLVSGDEDARVIVWDLATHKERFILDSRGWIGRSMALSPDGKTVAMGTAYNVIRLWDVATGKERFTDPPGHDASVHSVAFSHDGKLLVTGGANRQIHVWDAVSRRHQRQLQGQNAKAIAFSTDGKRLAAGWKWDASARVWDVTTGEEVLKLAHDAALGVHGIAFAPDGKALVSLDELKAGSAGHLNVWDAATGKRLRQVLLSLRPECLALSPDGKLAVIGGIADSPLRLCDVQAGKELAPMPSQQAGVVSAVVSPDGRLVATGGIDRTVCLWEAVSRQVVAQFQKHDRSVAALAFSPDGRVLASADGGPVSQFWQANPGQKIHLWEVASARELTQLDGHDSDVTSLAFSPDGKRLVSGLSNGTVLVWDISARALPAGPAAVELGTKELDSLWTDLASDDSSKAFAAICKLAQSPVSVANLRMRIEPAEAANEKQITRWIADLDSAIFADRDKAMRELERQAELAEPPLRKTLAGDPSPEVRRRIETLLSKLQGPVTSAQTLRCIRAVAVLEYVGSAEAVQLLRKLATGAPDARLTREAKAALERLAKHPVTSP